MKAEENKSEQRSVRSKKKRSVKPRPKSGSALKWILIVGGSLLVLLFVTLFGLSMAVKSWLHGDGFRERLIAKAETVLKAEVSAEGLDWQDSSLYIGSLQAQGYRDSAIAHLEVDGVRSVFDGARDQAWQVPSITLNQLSVEFSDDHLSSRAETVLDNDPKAGMRSLPVFLQRWVPQRAEIGTVRIDATNLVVLNSEGVETFSLRAVETASKPFKGSANGWRVQGRGGNLMIPQQPKMSVQNFDIRWVGTELFINSARLGFHDKALIDLDGQMVFGEEAQMNLRLQVSNLDADEALEAKWHGKVIGTISGEVDVVGDFTAADGLTQSGSIELENGVLKDLPILKKIVTYAKSPKFNPLALQEATFDFERHGENLVLTKIVIESDGLTRLEGNLTLQGENILLGDFRLGITPGTLSFIPGAEQKVFTDPGGGFLWTDVKIAGTVSQPSENLSQRLVGAAIDTLIEEAPGKVLETAKDAVTNPTGTVGGLLEQGSGALKGFVPFLK